MDTKNILTAILGLALVSFTHVGADEVKPYQKPDGSWVSLSGEITTVSPDAFRLDYGDGLITVEMDDWDHDADAFKLFPGENVVVDGRIDDDFWEVTSIEASSVYVEERNTYFFADPADEEAYQAQPGGIQTHIPEGVHLTLRGDVITTNGREFVLDTGMGLVEVDTVDMPYNPLDKEGFQRIEVGDYVRVSGEVENALFDNKELHASTILTLADSDNS